ncbi:MAG: DUF2339 domain-containing protein, partial [Clostridia bacterium]|nr:DUF2339 domain-containing protein [Deltaproteobacteria bacterium]
LLFIFALFLEFLGSRLRYWPVRFGALALAPFAACLWCVALVVASDHDPMYWAWAGWAYVSAAWLFLLWRNETTEHSSVSALAYGVTPLLLSSILGLTAHLAVERVVHTGVWALSVAALSPAAIVGIAMTLDARNRWPMLTFRRAALIGCEPVIVILAIWSFVFSFTSDGNPYPLPYVPLMTPLDLTQLFIVLAGTAWALRLRVRDRERFEVLSIPAGALLAAVLFVHLSAVCIRSVHHFADVPFDFDSLYASNLVQTSLSITWSVIALIVTALASRKKWRAIWFVGGALLALIVVKLFVVDLASIATVARIVSFLVVGLLLLLIGWVSPVPPRVVHVAS